MKYLSLYKTSTEHSDDNSRLVPNISLITDDKKLILTNENNISTEFNEVDIIESFDDIINRFPTGNSTGMPGLHIYVDRSDQSKAKNIKLLNDAIQWRSNYISNNGLSDTNQGIRINVDALLIDNMIDNIIMDKYDGNYKYYINIYNDHIKLYKLCGFRIEMLTIRNDGSTDFDFDNIFPSPTETRMISLYLESYNSDRLIYIELYNDGQQWRKDYISYNGLNDTGQPISMFVDGLNIDGVFMDKYDNSYNYHIDIYNNRIILLNNNSEEILTISSDGSFTILDIFNKFPYPIKKTYPWPDFMLGLKIYTDNTDQSKLKNNIKLYNDAQQYRKDYISINNLSDTTKNVILYMDALIIDDKVIDEYGDDNYNYRIDIYNDHIILLNDSDSLEVLTISSDGSVENYITSTP